MKLLITASWISIVLCILFYNPDRDYSTQPEGAPAPTEEEINQAINDKIKSNISKTFSDLDGRHFLATRQLKLMMKDPSTFEHHRTDAYHASEDRWKLIITYSAVNDFGVRRRGTISLYVSKKTGLILGVVE